MKEAVGRGWKSGKNQEGISQTDCGGRPAQSWKTKAERTIGLAAESGERLARLSEAPDGQSSHRVVLPARTTGDDELGPHA